MQAFRAGFARAIKKAKTGRITFEVSGQQSDGLTHSALHLSGFHGIYVEPAEEDLDKKGALAKFNIQKALRPHLYGVLAKMQRKVVAEPLHLSTVRLNTN